MTESVFIRTFLAVEKNMIIRIGHIGGRVQIAFVNFAHMSRQITAIVHKLGLQLSNVIGINAARLTAVFDA